MSSPHACQEAGPHHMHVKKHVLTTCMSRSTSSPRDVKKHILTINVRKHVLTTCMSRSISSQLTCQEACPHHLMSRSTSSPLLCQETRPHHMYVKKHILTTCQEVVYILIFCQKIVFDKTLSRGNQTNLSGSASDRRWPAISSFAV